MREFRNSCRNGNLEMIKFFLSFKFDKSYHYKKDYNFKVYFGKYLTKIKLLLNDKNINIFPEDKKIDFFKLFSGINKINLDEINMGMIFAAEEGNLHIVKYLLTLPQINPGYQGNAAIIGASIKGRLEMVKFLYSLPRVNVCADDNYAFKSAVENGRVDVVKFLSTLPEININLILNSLIYTEFDEGCEKTVKFLSSFHYDKKFINKNLINSDYLIDNIINGELK